MKKILLFIGLGLLFSGYFITTLGEEKHILIGAGIAVVGVILLVSTLFFKGKPKKLATIKDLKKAKALDDLLYKNKTFYMYGKQKGNTMIFNFLAEHLSKDERIVVFNFDTKTIENQGKTISFDAGNPLIRMPRMNSSKNKMQLAVKFPHGIIPIGESSKKEEKQLTVVQQFSLLLNKDYSQNQPSRNEIIEQNSTNPNAIWATNGKKQLTYAQAWLISVYDIYMSNAISDFCDGHQTKISLNSDKKMLENAWGIFERESLLNQLHWLDEKGGHSESFERTKEEVSHFDEDKIDRLKKILVELDKEIKLSEKGKIPYQQIEQKAKIYFKERFGYGADLTFHNLLSALQAKDYKRYDTIYDQTEDESLKESFNNLTNDKDFLIEESKRLELLKSDEGTNFIIWDIARLFMLSIMGYQQNWITENELWSLLYRNGKKIQNNYSSWKDMTDNFLEARQVWSGTENKDQIVIKKGIDKNFEDPQSVWNNIDFNLAFTENTHPDFILKEDLFKNFRLETYQLFYGNQEIGTVEHLDSDFLNLFGTYTLKDNVQKELNSYIDFSIKCDEMVESDDQEINDYVDKYEKQFSSIIESDEWMLIHPNGEEIKILVPNFKANNTIVWRWSFK